jgi:hypothetical protein
MLISKFLSKRDLGQKDNGTGAGLRATNKKRFPVGLCDSFDPAQSP